MNYPRYGLFAWFAFWMKCLECALNPQLHSLRGSPFKQGHSNFFILYEMACVFKARIDLRSNPNCDLKEVAGF